MNKQSQRRLMSGSALHGRRVIVIGAGIAGLTAGFRLQKLGCKVTVLEQQPHPGGRMITKERQGYRIDVAASVLSKSYRQMLALIAEAGLMDQIQATNDVLAVYREGVIHHLPGLSLGSLLKTDLFGSRTKLGLLRLLPDLLSSRRQHYWSDLSPGHRRDTESVSNYAKRMAPPEVAEYLLDAMCRSLYLAPSDEVSKLPLLFILSSMAGKSFFNSADGVGFLTSGLAKQLPVKYRATATCVEEQVQGVRVHWSTPGEPDREEEACAAIIALPSTQVAPILPQLTGAQKNFLGEKIYSPALVISLGLARPPQDSGAMWLNIAQRDSIDLNAIILEHNKAPGRAPQGKGLITTFWMREWSRKRWDTDDTKLAEEAFAQASRFLPSLRDEVDMADVRRVDPGASVRPAGGFASLARFVRDYPATSRVQLAGDYYSSITTNGSLSSGEQAAARIAEVLSAAKRGRVA